MFDRFNRSWALAKQSWQVMRSQPSLAIFPVISGIATLLVTVSFILPIFFSLQASGAFESGSKLNSHNFPVLYYVVMFCYYLVSYFVVVFFNVGFIHCASKVLNNEPTSVSEGISVALKRFGPILGWSLVAATVGLILRAISERVEIVGKIIVAIVGAGWNVVTYFVVPAVALEGLGPIAAIKESFGTIKKTWGETVIGNVGISLAMGLLTLVPIPMIIVAAFTQSVWVIVGAVGFAILFWLGLAIIGSCLSSIYTTAVFQYARTGQIPNVYTQEQLQMAFMQKPPSKVSGYFRPGR
ncbi:MAG: hypothetical protein JST12_04640 [Armatimonadetes bacterium]|nr:hypothetical protein [Armatimonadota bacterium]